MKNLLAITVTLLVLMFINSAFIVEPSALASRPTGSMPAQQQFTLSINSIEVLEGDQGTTNAVFTVTVSPAASFNVRVDYATADNTAIAGNDYTPATGTLTFQGGGNPTATISIPIIGDNLVEPPETFFVLLRNPSPSENVGIGRGAGICTIISNDTGSPALSIFGVAVDEGDGGNTNAVFRVVLNRAVQSDVRVDYSIESFSAVVGSDYFRPPGPDRLTILAGRTSGEIQVPVAGDSVPELTERFFVKLSNVRGGDVTIATGEASCDIRDDDNPGTITVCSDDTPKESERGDSNLALIDSNIRIDRDLIVDDLEVKLFLSNHSAAEAPDTLVTGELTRDGNDDDFSQLFQGLRVRSASSIGTTCTPAPDFGITGNTANRPRDEDQPYVGRWQPENSFLSEGRNARGVWRLGVRGFHAGPRVFGRAPEIRLECWCLTIVGPREGLAIEPSTAAVPIEVVRVAGDTDDFAAHRVKVRLNANGGPAAGVLVTFQVRDKGGQGNILVREVVTTDSRGRAYFGYRNWVPGDHTIEARATVNGAIYTDVARVTWTNACAATASVQGSPEAQTTLDALRSFRDSKLVKSKRGREYSRLYYKFSSEAVRLMMFNPMMLLRSQQMIERYMPVLRDMTAGKGTVLTEGDLNELEDFMKYFAAKGSPELRQTLQSLCEDLRSPEMHEELGVTITAGAKRELPDHNRPDSLNRVRSWGMLMGAGGLLLYGLTGKRLGFLRKSRKQIIVAIAAISVISSASPRASLFATAASGAFDDSSEIHSWESKRKPEESPVEKAEATSWSSAHSFQSLLRDSLPTPLNCRRRTEIARKIPFTFEANYGQSDSHVRFVARGPGYNLFLTPTEAALATRKSGNIATRGQELATSPPRRVAALSSVLEMKLIGANPYSVMKGLDQLPSRTNYFVGKERSKWRADVPSYAKVKSEDVYPGIDMLYYGNQRELEYDFIVAPGADPGAITLGFHGAEEIEIDWQGDLLLRVAGVDVRHRKPVAYQDVNGARREIACRYNLVDEDGSSYNSESKIQNPESRIGSVGFELGSYDPTLPLVIDPVLDYSTYLGGSGDDQGTAISLDAAGNIYIVGLTDSIDLPTTNPTQPNFGGGQDAFVAKLDPSGTRLIYLTYLGGNDMDTTTGMAVDSAGNAYVTGFTRSKNFPSLNALQSTNRGQFNSFVVKLGPTGNLIYSTYLGGTANDSGSGIAVDSEGNACVTGIATSPNFPTANALQPALSGAADVFVAKLNASGNQLLYSTYTGGSQEDAATSIAVDPSGNVYVTGATLSPDFRTANANQTAHGGGIFDAFVVKLNSSGNQLVYSTYLGGGNADRGLRIAADSSGNAYVTGDTGSSNFPTASAFQRNFGGSSDAFVVKLNSNGSIAYSSYLGGSGLDGGTAIAVSANGRAFVTGFTASNDFPTSGAVQAAYGGGSFDAFVAQLNASGSALEYSTYLGGGGTDSGFGIAATASSKSYILGLTDSQDFPTANPLQSGNRGGTSDLFVASISPGPGINGASIQGKHLIVTGGGFAEGVRILINGEVKKTTYLSATSLRGKKLGRMIGSGQTVRIQVRNPDGITSNEFSFMRP